ncbi:hypothetical protein ABT112_05435 [Streptomyces sp. NPDC002055]|uniref:hypothetical protein n=1 Tax=Streptomyces sp. NPDC002055 TaxID=3154534 RepID=UPI003327296F
MTSAERPAVPRQTPPAGSDGPAGATPLGTGPSLRRRIVTLLIVVLLVGIPAGYLVVSAQQSRESGKDKEGKAAATGLTEGWPSKVTRRIYDVPIQPYSAQVAFYESNSWKVSKLYVQFVTSDDGLERFLRTIGSSREELKGGRVTIGTKDAATVGWNLGAGKDWAGTRHNQPQPQPQQDITVDLRNKAHPKVYVVSTVTP